MGKQGPCYHCGVTSTPLWRNGPPEKPVLCNACGSRWRTKGSLVNYTPLHSRADGEENKDDQRYQRMKSISVNNKYKETKTLKRKAIQEPVLELNYGFKKAVVEEDASNRSSSGSAISNSESCAQFSSADGSELTGPSQSNGWDTTVPCKRRTCVGLRPKTSSVEKLTQDLYNILQEQQSSVSSEEEDLLFENEMLSMVSVEIGHGSVLMRNPHTFARGEVSEEASSLSSVENKSSISDAYSSHSMKRAEIGAERGSVSVGQVVKEEQLKRTKSQTGRVHVLGSHGAPLCSIDLKDIFNFDEFIEQFTEEEQKKLMRLLPQIDSVNLPDSLRMMFESAQFKENFSLFQKLIADGVFEMPSTSSEAKLEEMRSFKKLALSDFSKSRLVESYNLLKEGDKGSATTSRSSNPKDALVQNLEDLIKGKDTLVPVFDFQQKRRVDTKMVKASSGVVIVDGTYALHARLRSLLDIRVAVVGGVHFSLLSKVRYDIGDSCSLDYLIDSIFPLFRKHIEPDLHHAQIRINNSFVSSFREAIYKLKCKSEIVTSFAQGSEVQKDNFIEMYLRPPSANEEARINDWIKVRQAGIRYYLSLGDQRIVDKHFIIRPKAEFEVGRMTLGGLLALGYNVVVSYKRASTAVSYGNLSLSRETIDTLGETFLVLRGTDRKSVGAEALRMGISGPWITKSYLELILESKGVPRLNTPPLLQQSPVTVNQEKQIVAPKPIRTTPNIVTRLEDLSQPWTRSPTKSQMEPMVATWHFTSFDAPHSVSSGVDSSFRENIRLVPMPDSYDLDRGLLLSVQAIQALLENKGPPVIVGIGGPSGSGKTSLAHKMANIVGCEVVSLESYFKSEQVKDFKHDDFSSLDLPLLSKNIADITNSRRTKLPVFDLETGTRCGFKELEVSEECGVIVFEGVYALHPEIRQSLDLWVAVVGGVHSHLISRVQRDKSRVGCFMSQNEIMMTVFPMFQQHIEPHLVHAHVKIRNDFDPVLSPESSLFVLKSNKQVPYQDILSILDSTKFCSSVQNFIDIYFRLSGLPANGQLSDSDCIRVRICEGRFAVLIREPIREGNFIIQPKVDFDISVSTVAGLLNLGYQAVAYIEASAFIYQDGKILIEVDHLQDVPSPYIQIKGANKEAVTAAGSALKLDGSYTTKSYLQIVLERLPPVQRSSSGIHTQQAARLQELVEFIQSQGSSNSTSEASPRRDGSSIDNVLDDMQSRIKRLERWHTINTVLWTFLMSALVGYSLYQRKRQ